MNPPFAAIYWLAKDREEELRREANRLSLRNIAAEPKPRNRTSLQTVLASLFSRQRTSSQSPCPEA